GVERHRALVTVHHQEHRARAVVGDRRHPAILAAAGALDADHVGTEVGQERRAVRSGDVAPEVENADSGQDPPLVAHESTRGWPSRSSARSTLMRTANPFLSGSRSFSGWTSRRQTSSYAAPDL